MSFSRVQPKTRVFLRAFFCGILPAVPACQIPEMRPADPPPQLPPAFSAAVNTGPGQPAGLNEPVGAESSSRMDIDGFYKDPALSRLIGQAVANNRELKILNEDIQLARADILNRRGAYLPFVTVGAGASLEKPSRFTPQGAVEDQLEVTPGKPFPDPLANYSATADLTWQLDIWGQLRAARNSAAQRFLAAGERRNAFVTRMVAEVAENYYRLMALDIRIETLDKTIAIQEQSLKLAKANKDAGRGTELPVQRFQAEVYKNQSEKLIVKQDIVETENRINFLLNRFPAPVERSSAGFLDLNLQKLSAGVPAQLMQNRPDIRQAERELTAAGLDVQVARANFYPQLNLGAGIGYEAFKAKYLFHSPEALIANVAGNLVAPLINKTAIQAEYIGANARQLQAVYNYQRVVLNAFTEVVNRISMAENYRQSIDIKKQQLTSLEASVDSATKLFQNARADYLDVLFSQRDMLEAKMVLIDTKRDQLGAIVNAYQALGGGDLLMHSDNDFGDFSWMGDLKTLGGHYETTTPAIPQTYPMPPGTPAVPGLLPAPGMPMSVKPPTSVNSPATAEKNSPLPALLPATNLSSDAGKTPIVSPSMPSSSAMDAPMSVEWRQNMPVPLPPKTPAVDPTSMPPPIIPPLPEIK